MKHGFNILFQVTQTVQAVLPLDRNVDPQPNGNVRHPELDQNVHPELEYDVRQPLSRDVRPELEFEDSQQVQI